MFYRYDDGEFAHGAAQHGFSPWTGIHFPNLDPRDPEPRMEPEQMRAYGMRDYLVLQQLWPRLREVLAERNKKRRRRAKK